ncbi:hypothetical protein [Ruegeria sp. ANG-R]|uniref:hypothetical protein n=1 Tax=Ruegeria sp. ANG-R TaxID=1577903 RepID=UPI000AE0B815|nr:hypothetical protein [Ruegeria sp. ANG-R]
MILERQMVRPAKSGYMTEAQFEKSMWEPIGADTFAVLWDAEVETLPETETRKLNLLTGLILPIWTDIPGNNTRIYRVQSEDGSALLGRAIDDMQAATLRGKFMDVDATTPEDLLRLIADTDRSVDLGNGIALTRRRVAGHMRLELIGASRETLPWLSRLDASPRSTSSGCGSSSRGIRAQRKTLFPSFPKSWGAASQQLQR